ncbi:cytochrome P450 [Zychaea mexicana]|uniref:cytochrome P450 n=1 Tax=Zychaea mexicana TaxID=64656 RepID=UPI0022FEC711|nr:cytochrome P450 [Zychaea mexicana]KAI9496805.1 cytochrome P450 [Zychaea mexicana]
MSTTRQELIGKQIYSYRYYLVLAGAVTYVCRRIYRGFFTIPKKFQHIPAITFWDIWRSLATKEQLTDRTKRLVFPLLEKGNGIYMNKFPFDWTLYVANPILAKTVLFKPELASKAQAVMDYFPDESAQAQLFGKDNLSIANGKQWKEQRKIMNPAFHRSMPVAVFSNLMPLVFQVIEENDGNATCAIKLTKRLTLDAIGKAAFDFDFEALKDENSVWVQKYNQAFKGFMDPIPIIYPRLDRIYRAISKTRRDCYNAAFELIDLLDDLANQKRKLLTEASNNKVDAPQSEKDLLTLMLEAELNGEGSWTRQDLRHNMALFFSAGHDTTSHSLAFCLYELAANQDVQEKARQESFAVFGDELIDVSPTLEDCKKLPYIDQIIKETLRMHPPFNEINPRIAEEDLELGGTLIPKGTMVNIDIEALHYRPDLWKNPERFDPERFAEGGEHYSQEGITWAPFSGGSRQCIGINFSMMEQRIALSMLLRKYTLMLPENSKHKSGVILDLPINFAPESLEIHFVKRY